MFTTRAILNFEVQPSFEFRYATIPSVRNEYPFMLNIEVNSSFSPRPFYSGSRRRQLIYLRQAYNSGIPCSDLRVTSISLLSPTWKLSSLPGLAFEDLASQLIAWQGVTNLAFSVDRTERTSNEQGTTSNWSVSQVEALLRGKKIEGSKPRDVQLECSNVPPVNLLLFLFLLFLVRN